MTEIRIHPRSPDMSNDHSFSLFLSFATVILDFAFISRASPDATSWVPGLAYKRGKIEDF
jgi:hypothetical protein